MIGSVDDIDLTERVYNMIECLAGTGRHPKNKPEVYALIKNYLPGLVGRERLDAQLTIYGNLLYFYTDELKILGYTINDDDIVLNGHE